MDPQRSRALVQKVVEYCYGKRKHSAYDILCELRQIRTRDPGLFDNLSVIVCNVIRDVEGKLVPDAQNGMKKWTELSSQVRAGSDDPVTRSLA